ncbi:MAG TPA: hypothetical protein VK731_13485 [Candidatus Cybelea sp.]|jgi:cholesterol transport system auxiliary component|nr:hypothetical protein [Candidatus Cybelea sp.]
MNTSNVPPRWITPIFLACFLVFAAAMSGCLSRPALSKQTFFFGVPAVSATNAVTNSRVLAVRKLQIAPPFDERSLVYRTGEFSYVRDPYAGFLDPPAEDLIGPVLGWLRANCGFSVVVGGGSALKPDTLVEISVIQLFGDFRQPERPFAVMTMRLAFFDAPNGVPGKTLFQKEYSRSVPLNSPTPGALMNGWNQELASIFIEVSSELPHSEVQQPHR